jgi:hypothetical protein
MIFNKEKQTCLESESLEGFLVLFVRICSATGTVQGLLDLFESASFRFGNKIVGE